MRFWRSTVETSSVYVDEAFNARCMGNMARVLVLCSTGQEFDDEPMERLQSDVASVAEEFYLSPEDVQAILLKHEPSLAEHVG